MKLMRHVQPWAETRKVIEQPDGTYEARYGSATLGYYPSATVAEKAIQDVLRAHKEAKQTKRRFTS
jgi:hypothetical protein